MYYDNFFLLFSCISSFLLHSSDASLKSESIINGDLAVDSDFPYHVLVKSKSTGSDCGGSIISLQHVLTAAHCVADETTGEVLSGLRVVAGIKDLRKCGMRRSVIKVFLTKKFVRLAPYKAKKNSFTDMDDIAVLKLKRKLTVKSPFFIDVVKLPAANNLYKKAQGIIAGFGVYKMEADVAEDGTVHLKTYLSDQLRYVKSEVDEWRVCADYFNKTVINENNYICAISPDSGTTLATVKNVCRGDSGGGLVVDNTVIGVLSEAASDCIGMEAIYMRVSAYREFIDNAMKETTDPNIYCESLESKIEKCPVM